MSFILFFAAITEYFSSKNEMVPSFGHVFFIAMMVSKLDGALMGAMILSFAGIVPNLMLGSMNALKITSYLLQFASVIAFSYLSGSSYILLGIFLCALAYALTFMIAKALGSTLPELIMDAIIPFSLNLVYYLSFAQPIVGFVGRALYM